jgi:hypothetical protein
MTAAVLAVELDLRLFSIHSSKYMDHTAAKLFDTDTQSAYEVGSPEGCARLAIWRSR